MGAFTLTSASCPETPSSCSPRGRRSRAALGRSAGPYPPKILRAGATSPRAVTATPASAAPQSGSTPEGAVRRPADQPRLSHTGKRKDRASAPGGARRRRRSARPSARAPDRAVRRGSFPSASAPSTILGPQSEQGGLNAKSSTRKSLQFGLALLLGGQTG